MADTEVKPCDGCGASVYPEHIGAQKAGYWRGKLFCVHCFAEHRQAQITIGPDDFAGSMPTEASAVEEASDPAAVLGESADPLAEPFGAGEQHDASSTTSENDAAAIGPGEEAEISLSNIAPPAIKPLSTSTLGGSSAAAAHKFKRHLQHNERGAIRCRIFHAKLNDGALHFMQDQINDWIDENPEVDIKHLSTNVGVVEGKSSEPHLVITLFY